MSDTYDVQHFEPDYCHKDISKIVAAIQSKASLLVVGMPGCGKSRLIDFLLHRQGIREKYGLPGNLKFVRAECDNVGTGPHGMYLELLRALGHNVQALSDSSQEVLKNRLMAEVSSLEAETDLVVIFDNFTQPLQQALGETFFNFLFALRNIRPRLNVVYIFVANLNIDFNGFHKLNRLFDQGADRSIGWVSLLNWPDTLFSINRQLHKDRGDPDRLSVAYKERIYELAGGHALLNRYLTHLMLHGEILLETEPDQILQQGGIRTACEAIWHDLDRTYQSYLIDMATHHLPAQDREILQNYGVLKDQKHFFSPLFEHFVRSQKIAPLAIDVSCDPTQTRLSIKSHEHLTHPLHGLTKRQKRLFCYLVENLNETCRKDQLIEVGWPTDDQQGVSDQALSRQIDRIRGWLKKSSRLSDYLLLETIWGEGYQLVLKD